MGIKGIYGEIGPGERIALSKLAVQKFEETGRPLRIAVDISIWQFQVQSGRGGTNPALRTLYYRLLRLLTLSIQPLFVFDGKHKPVFKRDKRVGANTASLPDFMAKQLIKLFGFPYHIAPGEAEAECALLQRERLVDAVLSEDVDTLMFGCGLTLRNWSSDGTKGTKSPTHVSVYDAEKTRAGKAGLDRAGMVLVAMMSGGDYVPAGVPGCGIKAACEAARAGFGKSLCELSRADAAGIKTWRETLSRELRTNESKFFRVKHKALQIPEDFPDKTVLGYYTHPAISSAEKVATLKSEIDWEGDVDVPALRGFVAEAFDWRYKSGARHFVRGLAPGLLVQRLRRRAEGHGPRFRAQEVLGVDDTGLLTAISGKREHSSTDRMQEIRLSHIPLEIVGLDMDAEDSEDDFDEQRASAEADESAGSGNDDASEAPPSPSKKRQTKAYDPSTLDKAWVLDSFVRRGAPEIVRAWEESSRAPKKPAARKAATKRVKPREAMKKGAMSPFVRVTKPGISAARDIPGANPPGDWSNTGQSGVSELPKPAGTKVVAASQPNKRSRTQGGAKAVAPRADAVDLDTASPLRKSSRERSLPSSSPQTSLPRRPSDTLDLALPRGTRYSALGIYGPPEADPPGSPGEKQDGLPVSGSEVIEPRATPRRPTTPTGPRTNGNPSPRKRQSPKTGRTSRAKVDRNSTRTASPGKRCSSRKVAHRAEAVPDPPSPSSPSSLPSPSMLVTPRKRPDAAISIASSPPLPSPTLPPPSKLLTPHRRSDAYKQTAIVIDSLSPRPRLCLRSTSQPRQALPANVKAAPAGAPVAVKRSIALRQSVEGAYADIDSADELVFAAGLGSRRDVWKDVEVVDLVTDR
ncbi:MAG: hypothetical protein M1832_005156 [Thelocarpon impressellum]|nr:MAG: hypothetical protein M1832_005156 [Thelocarpon impressellum]